jgi:hypothetical protein
MRTLGMNVVEQSDAGSSTLVEIIEMKWLLAGLGIRLHVEKLQHDADYARRTLAVADAAPNAALRQAAQRLRHKLGLSLA